MNSRRTLGRGPEELQGLRSWARRWALNAGASPQAAEGLVFCVNELAANAMEHAYSAAEPAGKVTVVLSRRGPSMSATVSDHGRWSLDPAPSPNRGRGLPLVRALAASLQVDTSPSGTVVRVVLDGARDPFPRGALQA